MKISSKNTLRGCAILGVVFLPFIIQPCFGSGYAIIEQSVTGLGNAFSGGDAGESALVPNFYYAHPAGDNLVLALGIHVPFGLATEYDADWVGRYHAIKSDLKSINFNPSLAYRLSYKMTLGLGFSVQQLEAELSNAIDFGLAGFSLGIPGFAPNGVDAKITITGDDVGYGYNIGFLYEVSEDTRFGLHYRSHIKHTLEGNAYFVDVPAPFAGTFFDQPATADVTTPETISISLYHQPNDAWALMGDFTWTKWDRFRELAVDFSNIGTPDSSSVVNWGNTIRLSVGASYNLSENIKLRTGLAYDQSPISGPKNRTPRIPDEDRFWVAFGLSIYGTENAFFHWAYVHIFVDDPVIDRTESSTHSLKGVYDASVDIISAQVTFKF